MKNWIICIVLPLALTAQEAPRSRAAWADDLVQHVFAEPSGFQLGFDEQSGRMLGDSVASAVTRKVRLTDLLSSEKAERVLTLLTYAFRNPEMIQAEEDRKPGVTLLLLDHIANYSPDPVIRKRATDLVKSYSSPHQAGKIVDQ